MPRRRRAGQNIRELALRRRMRAIAAFVQAGLVLFSPLLLAKFLDNFWRQLPSSESETQPLLQLPLFYIFAVVVSLYLIAQGIFLWKRANNADQGAIGEEEIAQEMIQLEQDGWQIDYGLRLGKGDVDIVCTSPRDKTYVIDVKSHRGEVIADREQLRRRMGKTTYGFEKNFLSQAMRQAIQIKELRNLSFVTPVIVFSSARVSVPNGKLKNVYVVEKSRLVSLLRSLG